MDNHNPPPRDQIVGYFNYLLDGFNLFYDAPRPVLKKSTRTRAPTAEERDSEERFGGLDSRNREGVIRLFTHYRSF